MKIKEQRRLINKQQRKKIEKGLESLKILIQAIKNSKSQKIPQISLLHLIELEETLEDILLKDGLSQQRLEEIKKEFLRKRKNK